jgi:hypothetical protein
MDFTKWLDRMGGSPGEVSDRHRIRSILGTSRGRPIRAFPLEAWVDSGAAAAGVLAISAAAGCAFPAIAASVAGAAALAVAFSRHQPSVEPIVDGPAPVSAGVSVVPGPASGSTCPAVAGISGPPSDCPYSEARGVRRAEYP